jgi:beta-galactosidase
MTVLPRRVLFGAAYYTEYQPYERLKIDLDLMVDAGFSVIRVGESVWSTWEPENGVFDLDWLQPVLDGAHSRGISVVLGTPTYAVPPWLQRTYPEIAAERRTGERVPWGARQEVDHTHPGFRFHAERVVRNVVARYAEHPAVIGYQVDNEPGLELLHNRGVFQRFVDTLRRTYGDVETLNREWGLTYWSHRLSTWADLWTPDGNTLPQYDLAWRRFQADLTTEFIGWQADIVREYARADQFVTTCIAYSRPAVEDDALTRRLDVTAGNPYYGMQDALAVPEEVESRQGWATAGTWSLFLSADRMYASRQEQFLVTETDATSIGGSHMNHPAYDGQWRQAAWALVARGARMIEYWHWHTLHSGPETYWGGVLPHSLQPGRVYREIARLGAEFAAAGDAVVDLEPDADVALLYSLPSRWAFDAQPPLADSSGAPDRNSYAEIVAAFHRGVFAAGRQTRILHVDQLGDAEQLAARFPVLVVPALYVADDDTLDLLEAYARAGGHLVLGIRTGYADTEARARHEVVPARLWEAAGVRYDEYSNLSGAVPVTPADGSPLALPPGAMATRWADGLQLAGAEALASYEHPHLGRWPAATTRAHGAGRITYVGTVPDAGFARALAGWLATDLPDPWRDRPASVTVTGARDRNGDRLRFVHNWSWDAVDLPLPTPVRDVLAGNDLPAGSQLQLTPWDVRVLREHP